MTECRDEGGFTFWPANYQDVFFRQEANPCADYLKRKICKTVKDPVVAEELIPRTTHTEPSARRSIATLTRRISATLTPSRFSRSRAAGF